MNKNVLKLAVPSIFANITVPLVGMVDLAIAGRLGDASLIGGIAIATMLFDLLYWNMGFLRVGTGGLIAQAYGRRDFKDAMRVFTQGLATSLSVALFIWIIQYLYVEAAFSFITCSPEVEQISRDYFFIRIWAAPATLTIFVFKGFFIGMQNAVSSMVLDLTINIVNLVASIYFALYAGMGFSGIAMGTVVAQYSGIAVGIWIIGTHYKKLFKYLDIRNSVKLKYLKNFFMVNSNLFIRSICFLFVYTGFTSISARYGDSLLAIGTIIMKLMMIYSYFIDGFAYAGEALSGKYIGAKDAPSLRKAIKIIFMWCAGIAVISTIIYITLDNQLFSILTDNKEILLQAQTYLPWMWIMPILSCWAFTWDGIFIGATATKAIRNSMIYAVIGFFITYYSLESILSFHALWAAYMVHLVIRASYLNITAKKEVYGAINKSIV